VSISFNCIDRIRSKFSELWLGWGQLKTALSWTLGVHVSDESDVAFFSPFFTPGVLDDPVVLTSGLIGTESNKEDTVVEVIHLLGIAEFLEDTSEVELPSNGSSIDSNGDWSMGKSSGKSKWVS